MCQFYKIEGVTVTTQVLFSGKALNGALRMGFLNTTAQVNQNEADATKQTSQ